MGWIDTGIAKTRAVASDARADLAETNSDLFPAQSRLRIATAADDLVNRFGGTCLARQQGISSLVAAASAQTHALRARAQAELDEITAKREAAATRLSMAEKSQHAMTRLAEETDKILG